nr:uncharacterized protein LOC129380923 isoform X1 [Dermacentor andersoni]
MSSSRSSKSSRQSVISEPGDVFATAAGAAKTPPAAAPVAATAAGTSGDRERRKRKRSSAAASRHRRGHRTKAQGSTDKATPAAAPPVEPANVTPVVVVEDESSGTQPPAATDTQRGTSTADFGARDAEAAPAPVSETSTASMSQMSHLRVPVQGDTRVLNEQAVSDQDGAKLTPEDPLSAAPSAPPLRMPSVDVDEGVSEETAPWPQAQTPPLPNESPLPAFPAGPLPVEPTVPIPAVSEPSEASSALAAKPSKPTGILKTPTADRRASGQEVVPDMIVVPLTSWAGTPDVTADRKCALPPVSASTFAECSAFVERSRTPQQDTSLVRHRGKKTHFGVPSLKPGLVGFRRILAFLLNFDMATLHYWTIQQADVVRWSFVRELLLLTWCHNVV